MKKLSKILTSLSDNGFLHLKNQKIKSFDTLGLLVRDNINNQLNKFLKQNDKFSYFLSNELNDAKYIVNTISKFDSLINSFGLVYKKSDLNLENELIFKSDYINRSNRYLALFCKKELSLSYFHWLQSKRHRFWRKLSTNPSNFQITNVNIDNNQNQNLNIIYNDDDLDLRLENITYFKTLKHLELLDKQSNDNTIDYWNNLDLILCETNVDLSTISLLYNSYNEKDNKSFMKLSEHLTPYQYSITVVNKNKRLENRSKELINYIFDQSKSIDLNIYPFVDFNDKDNLIFDRNDSIGILYTIIIEEDELDNGFLSLRNRDTDLIEKFHITQLKSYLQLYAKGN